MPKSSDSRFRAIFSVLPPYFPKYYTKRDIFFKKWFVFLKSQEIINIFKYGKFSLSLWYLGLRKEGDWL